MISQVKLDKLSKKELYIFAYIFKDFLLDKNQIGDRKLDLHRLKWLQLNTTTISKIKQSENLVKDECKSSIDSIIRKLIT